MKSKSRSALIISHPHSCLFDLVIISGIIPCILSLGHIGQVKEWLQSLGIVDQMAVVPDDDEPDDGAVPLNHAERTKNRFAHQTRHGLNHVSGDSRLMSRFCSFRSVPSRAALPILRPSLGRQQTVSERAKVAMHNYLNHFLGNLDIVNSREVCEFLEVSKLSFSSEYGPKLKEGYVLVKHLRKLSRINEDVGCFPCLWFGFWSNNWQKVVFSNSKLEIL